MTENKKTEPGSKKEFIETVEQVAQEHQERQKNIFFARPKAKPGMIYFYCPGCSSGLFRESNRLAKISGLATGNGQPGLAVVKVFLCEYCERETGAEEILSNNTIT